MPGTNRTMTMMVMIPTLPIFHQVFTKIKGKVQVNKILNQASNPPTQRDPERCIYRIMYLCTPFREHTARLIAVPADLRVSVFPQEVQTIARNYSLHLNREINDRRLLLKNALRLANQGKPMQDNLRGREKPSRSRASSVTGSSPGRPSNLGGVISVTMVPRFIAACRSR